MLHTLYNDDGEDTAMGELTTTQEFKLVLLSKKYF